jgi:hypothetical protein
LAVGFWQKQKQEKGPTKGTLNGGVNRCKMHSIFLYFNAIGLMISDVSLSQSLINPLINT